MKQLICFDIDKKSTSGDQSRCTKMNFDFDEDFGVCRASNSEHFSWKMTLQALVLMEIWTQNT